jgi:hypothetical protein
MRKPRRPLYCTIDDEPKNYGLKEALRLSSTWPAGTPPETLQTDRIPFDPRAFSFGLAKTICDAEAAAANKRLNGGYPEYRLH